MKKFLKLGFVIGCLVSSLFASETQKFSTGSITGMYYKQGQSIAKLMSEKGISSKVYSSEGGEQNGRRVANNITQFGLIQSDTHRLMNATDRLYASNVQVIGKVSRESILIAVNKNGRIDDDSDLQNNGVIIAVTSKSAGANSSYKFMSKLETDFSKAQIVVRKYNQAIRELKAGTIDAIMFVQNVQFKNDKINFILKDKELDFIDVTDGDLDDKLGGVQIYTSCKVSVAKGWLFDKKVKTICVDSLLIVNKNVDEHIQDITYNILEQNRNRIVQGK